jgi:hypothetical protein
MNFNIFKKFVTLLMVSSILSKPISWNEYVYPELSLVPLGEMPHTLEQIPSFYFFPTSPIVVYGTSNINLTILGTMQFGGGVFILSFPECYF